jgi:tryptophanyl-tRNA synthetase
MKKVILTGDRPTGHLHLGHYVGSLKKRVELQKEYDTYILIADVQALTDNAENPEKIRNNIVLKHFSNQQIIDTINFFLRRS